MLTAAFLLGLLAALTLLWKVISDASPQRKREIRVTGVDYYHSDGKRLWDNYDPKKDWLFVVSKNQVLHEISPKTIIGASRQDSVVQYKNEGDIETIALEKFLGSPNCIRVQNKIIINRF